MKCDTRQTIQKRLTGSNSCAGTSCIASPVGLLLEFDMETQVCNKCEERKPKTDFSKRRDRLGRYYTICKKCKNVASLAYRHNNIEKIRVSDIARKRNNPQPYNAERKRQNKYQNSAHRAVARAISLGRIEKPKCCSDCNENRPLHGHHEDYSKPLDVEWLCSPCHYEVHRLKRIEKGIFEGD